MSLATLVQTLTDLPEATLVDYVDTRQTEECPPEALIVLIAVLRDACDDLYAIRKRIEDDVRSEFAPEKTTFQVPQLGPVDVGWKSVRTGWDKERLLPAALSRITDKVGVLCDEDGVTHPPAVIAQNIYAELHKIVGFGAPKNPGIKALGFEPDDYSTVRYETSVSLPKRAV